MVLADAKCLASHGLVVAEVAERGARLARRVDTRPLLKVLVLRVDVLLNAREARHRGSRNSAAGVAAAADEGSRLRM
eukprot:CAMPEP_0119405652 /NCGR_PEP_ID=MMETSP1335-20130426/256_1 /TAXON_ID=259385 /ORGANISM="Chrysoculter rhomboideus, Strain RCC1486" /LENGTH=76 /DNA_ID=CAMNT_0007429675 /DNA_START=516 /DNA_END=742 /DNA_ORIENTATION=-